jgi:hypothetical protein
VHLSVDVDCGRVTRNMRPAKRNVTMYEYRCTVGQRVSSSAVYHVSVEPVAYGQFLACKSFNPSHDLFTYCISVLDVL